MNGQYNHHCLLSFHGFNWWITGCRGHVVYVSRDIPGHANCIINAAIDISAVDWESYSRTAVAWDYENARALQ